MAIKLRLEGWPVCPSGYARYERKPQGTTSFEQAGGGWYVRPLSKQRRERSFFADDARDAYVLRFVNATSNKALLAFCAECGLPDAVEEMMLDRVQALRDDLRLLLHLLSRERAAPLFRGPRVRLELAVERKATVLALRCETLADFMRAEAAVLLSGGGTLLSCRQCGNLFTGRAGAQCCSERCRKAFNRQKRR